MPLIYHPLRLAPELGHNLFHVDGNADQQMCMQVDSEQRVRQRSMKYLQALAKGCWVVGFSWLEACRDKQAWVPEEPYEASGDSVAQGAPRTLRRARQADKESLFAGQHIAVTGLTRPKKASRRGRHGSPDKAVLISEMAGLLEACGAEVGRSKSYLRRR